MAKGRLSVKDEAGVLEFLAEYWLQATGFIALVVGYVETRLKTRQNEKDIADHKEENDRKIAAVEGRMEKRRSEDREMMAEIRQDIKTLLERH